MPLGVAKALYPFEGNLSPLSLSIDDLMRIEFNCRTR